MFLSPLLGFILFYGLFRGLLSVTHGWLAACAATHRRSLRGLKTGKYSLDLSSLQTQDEESRPERPKSEKVGKRPLASGMVRVTRGEPLRRESSELNKKRPEMSETQLSPLPPVPSRPSVGPTSSPVRSSRARKRYRAALQWGSGLAAVALLALTLICVHLRPNDQPVRIVSTDYWENARLVGLLIFSLDSGDGLVFKKDNVLQKTPYVIGLAWAGHLLGWNAHQVFLTMGTLNVLLLGVALVRFGRRWTHRRVPWGFLIVVPLLFWGKGFFQSNEYHLATLPMTAAYPSTFSFALSLLSLSLLADVCRLGRDRTGRAIAWVAAAALLAAVALSHLLTFLCFFVPTAGLTGLFLARSKRAWGLSLLVFPAIAVCLLFWPWPEIACKPLLTYLNMEKTGTPEKQNAAPELAAEEKKSDSEASREEKVSFDPDVYEKHYKINKMLNRAPAICWGFGLLAVLCVFRRKRREVWGLAAAALLFLLAWAVTGYLSKIVMGHPITMGYRFLYFCGLFLQLAAVRCVWDFSAGPRRWWLVSAMALLFVLIPGRDCLKESQERYFGSWPPVFIPSAQLDEIRALTGRQTVLAGNDVSYYLPAFNIKSGWVGRMQRSDVNPLNPIVRTWLNNQTDENLARVAQLEKIDAHWLLFDKTLDGDAAPPRATKPDSNVVVLRLPAESPLLQRVFENERYILFHIQREAPASSLSPTPAPEAGGATGGAS